MTARAPFDQQVSDILAEMLETRTAIIKTAAQRVVEVMQEPGPSKSNPTGPGLIPVDVGFLRASLTATTGDSLPSQPAPKGRTSFAYNASAVALAIAEWDFSAPLSLIYTAAYARTVHYKVTPWVTLAVQRAPQIEREVAAEFSRGSK